MRRGTLLATAALALACASLAGAVGAVAGGKPGPTRVGEAGTPGYGADGSVAPQAEARTVPTWSSAFTFQGRSYPYTMVGTSPLVGATTTVPVVLVPLRLSFA